MTAFATVDELENRLKDMDVSDEERTVMAAALDDASDLVRAEGLASWQPGSAPPICRVIVLNACARHIRLLEGAITSRAGDEALTWADMGDRTGTVFLDADQRRMAREAANVSSAKAPVVGRLTGHGSVRGSTRDGLWVSPGGRTSQEMGYVSGW